MLMPMTARSYIYWNSDVDTIREASSGTHTYPKISHRILAEEFTGEACPSRQRCLTPQRPRPPRNPHRPHRNPRLRDPHLPPGGKCVSGGQGEGGERLHQHQHQHRHRYRYRLLVLLLQRSWIPEQTPDGEQLPGQPGSVSICSCFTRTPITDSDLFSSSKSPAFASLIRRATNPSCSSATCSRTSRSLWSSYSSQFYLRSVVLMLALMNLLRLTI